jgi:hypothetical protein
MQRILIGIGAASLLLIGLTGVFGGNALHVSAQDGNGVGDCEDPFEGQTIRFNVSFWQETDFCQRSIDLSTVISGGPPPDGIPPIDNPVYESIADAAEWLSDESPVVVVEVNDAARAYPLAILTWHEIVNTDLGGEPITVTFCPLCNSALVFDRTVDGEVLDFGVSGNLRNSDLIMFDRQTDSWWQQFTGEGIVGTYTGTTLELIPSQVVGFAQFVEAFPDAEVLSRETGASRSYGRNPYAGYDGVETPFLFEGDIDERLPATSRVLAGVIAGEPMAYPFPALQDEIVINDTVGERNVVAIWQPGSRSALDAAQIDTSRDIGTVGLFSRELADGTVLTFTLDGNNVVDEQTGSTWNLFGRATAGELEGTELRPLLAAPHFWFAWAAFQPETTVYGLE